MPYGTPFVKAVKHEPRDPVAAHGIMYHDLEALNPGQRQCSKRLSATVQLEQEHYMARHPEVQAMLEVFFSKMMLKRTKKSGFLKECVSYFTRPTEELDKEIRHRLKIGSHEPYYQGQLEEYNDKNLEGDLLAIIEKCNPPEPWSIESTEKSRSATVSSSFLSAESSDTTVPTPEPIPTPPLTTEEVFYGIISNTVDKAIFLHIDEQALRYDFAYVEVAKAVEEAMEIPVIEIREDIAMYLYNMYEKFQLEIIEKERIAAEIAWEKRMRKKLKKMLRRQDNFKGWVTPPTPKSKLSSHPSYVVPPPRPCICHPQFRYNRYPKDRYGIYLPSGDNYSRANVTPIPDIVSAENADENQPEALLP